MVFILAVLEFLISLVRKSPYDVPNTLLKSSPRARYISQQRVFVDYSLSSFFDPSHHSGISPGFR